jgi:hypothetical protein
MTDNIDALSKRGPKKRKKSALCEMQAGKGLVHDGALVAAEFEVLGRARDPDGSGWSTYLRWSDPDGREHTLAVSDARLHGDVGALCGDLAQRGLKITTSPAKRAMLVAYLNHHDTAQRVTVVTRTGWCTLKSGKVYVTPDRTLGDAGDEKVTFLGAQNPRTHRRARWTNGVTPSASSQPDKTASCSASRLR